MQGIIQHIEYLLDHHQCVIIPGLGAFLSQHQPAVIDDVNGRITPPCRVISFNSDLTHDDGLLATSYARQLSLPYTTARAALDADVAQLKAQLNHNGEITVGLLGQLIKKSDLIEYVPANTLYTTMGYESVPLPQYTESSTYNQNSPSVATTEPPITVSRFDSRLHKIMRYAAMLVFLMTVGIVMTTLQVSQYDHNAVKASLSPMDMIASTTAAADPAIEAEADTAVPQFLIAQPSVESIEDNIEPAINSNAAYCLVIASLANETLANQFIAETPDMELGVIESNGRYRVYAATGATIAEVMKADICARYPDAWPCRVK